MRYLLVVAALSLGLISCGKAQSTDQDTITKAMSGAWAGTGTMTVNSGSATACQNLSFTLTYTNIDVTVSSLNATCTGSTVSQGSTTFQYSGSLLYYNGTLIGNISDSAINVNYSVAGENVALQFTLTDPTHIAFIESTSDTNSSMNMSGTLTHQ